jgi:predicted secreted Zn-dependent protease
MEDSEKRSNGNGAVWKRSSRCDNRSGNCVEVAALPGATAVRDSADPEGPVLVYARNAWRAFVDGVKRGEFDHD